MKFKVGDIVKIKEEVALTFFEQLFDVEGKILKFRKKCGSYFASVDFINLTQEILVQDLVKIK